jgi:hypothetical protein
MIPKSGNKNVDTALTIAIIIAIIYALNLLLKVFKGVGDVVQDPVGTVLGHTDTPLPNVENLPINTNGLTHPESQFDIWANQLYDAIWGFFADKQAVRDIMYQINSDDDLKMIIKKYGTHDSWINTGGGTLPEHLREIMPIEDINGFNYHFAGWGMKLRI